MLKLDWTRRDKTILHLIPVAKYLDQESFAFQQFPGTTIFDWRLEFLERARSTQKRLGTTVSNELNRIRAIGNSDQRVFSVINAEYLLAFFSEEERDQFWLGLWSDFPQLKGFIIFTTLNATALLPNSIDLQMWKEDGRLIG